MAGPQSDSRWRSLKQAAASAPFLRSLSRSSEASAGDSPPAVFQLGAAAIAVGQGDLIGLQSALLLRQIHQADQGAAQGGGKQGVGPPQVPER